MESACQICEQNFPDNENYATCLWSIGILHKQLGQKTAARERLESALRIYEKMGINECDKLQKGD